MQVQDLRRAAIISSSVAAALDIIYSSSAEKAVNPVPNRDPIIASKEAPEAHARRKRNPLIVLDWQSYHPWPFSLGADLLKAC